MWISHLFSFEESWHQSGGSRGYESREGIYVDTIGSTNGSELATISSRSGSRKSGATLSSSPSSLVLKPVQMRRGTKRSKGIGGSTNYTLSGPVSSKDKDNCRTRIYSHRDNDEIFADLTYDPRQTTTRSFIIPETARRGVVVDGSEEARLRTASDTSHWLKKKHSRNNQRLSNLPLNARTLQTILAASTSINNRPRAQSLTSHKLAVSVAVTASKALGIERSTRETSTAVTNTPSLDTHSLEFTRSNSNTSAPKSIKRVIEHALGK